MLSNILLGNTFGSYRIVHRIGEGGMGEVYLAEHMHMQRMAAIKVLRPQYAANVELVERFFAEARSANLINHPAIVEIYDCATLPDGSAYIVMEYLEGQTLGAALGRLGCVSEALTLVDLSWQIATALQAAHDKGIIHRDLKPDNIFLTFLPDQAPNPVVKILDFGIAKLLHSTVKATQTGSLLGTPLYMSPEQARGSGLVDHRTDIYSQGCIMFEMTTGRPPFVREGVGELIIAHASEIPPAPSIIKPSIPPEIDQLIIQMLAKNPAHRPQSMQEIATRLDVFRVKKSAMAATRPFLPDLDDGHTSQYRRPLPSAPDPGPEAKPRPRKVAATAILPPSERDFRSPRSVIRHPMVAEHSWIARVQETSPGRSPQRGVVPMPRPSTPPSAASDAGTVNPVSSRPFAGYLLRIAGGLLIGGMIVLIVLVTRKTREAKDAPQSAPQSATPVEVVLPVLAPSPSPAAVPTPQAAALPPATAPSSATATMGSTTNAAPDKPKRPSNRQPTTDTGRDANRLRKRLRAEAMDAAKDAFMDGNFATAAIQAERAIRHGAGVHGYLFLAESQMRLRAYPEAIRAYTSVLELDPDNSIAKLGIRVCISQISH